MATYTPLHLYDMLEVLRPEKGWVDVTPAASKEHVFEYRLREFPHIAVKVYSSIETKSSVSRHSGADAIRVCAVDLERKRGLIKSRRVHRVAGWRENLKSRILQVIAELEARLRRQPNLTAPPAPPPTRWKPIADLMHHAAKSLTSPRIVLEMDGASAKFSIAGDMAKHPGSITVSDGGPFGESKWYGRVLQNGELHLTKEARENQPLRALIDKFAENPYEVAKEYGKKSGKCCFCGHALSTEDSVKAGYGPVCAINWGLPWGKEDEVQ